MSPFPIIPTIETGMALGATALNAYHSGLRYCLGRSHEPTAAQLAADGSTTGTNWAHIYTWYLPYRGDRIGFRYRLRNGGVYQSYAHIELRVLVGATETVVYSDVTGQYAPDDDKSVAVDSLDITSLGLTAGTVYEWRLYLKRSGNDGWVYCTFWELHAFYNTVTGWVTPPTFVADAVSAAADLNKFRTDINALRTYKLDMAKGLTCCPSIVYTSGSTAWITSGMFAYRYRPNRLRLNIWCQSGAGATYAWNWLVTAQKWGGSEVGIYTAPQVVQSGDYGVWGTEGNVDTSTLGYALGDWILLRFKIKGNAQTNLRAVRYLCQRYSTGAPAAGWQALTDWAEGDTDIGPTNLNKISADLNALYSGEVEALWGHLQGVGRAGAGQMGNMLNQYRHTGPHIRRWLHYKKGTNQTPLILYGPNLTRSETLGTESGWQVYDMASSEVAPGSTYEVTGCEGAFEHDSAVF